MGPYVLAPGRLRGQQAHLECGVLREVCRKNLPPAFTGESTGQAGRIEVGEKSVRKLAFEVDRRARHRDPIVSGLLVEPARSSGITRRILELFFS